MNVTASARSVLSSSVIDFMTPANPVGNGTGLFDIIAGSTGSIVPMIGTYNQHSRFEFRSRFPLAVPVNYANFVTFVAQPDLEHHFDANLLPGVFPSAQCG